MDAIASETLSTDYLEVPRVAVGGLGRIDFAQIGKVSAGKSKRRWRLCLRRRRFARRLTVEMLRFRAISGDPLSG